MRMAESHRVTWTVLVVTAPQDSQLTVVGLRSWCRMPLTLERKAGALSFAMCNFAQTKV